MSEHRPDSLRRVLALAVCALALSATPSSSWAEGWPTLSGGLDHARRAAGQLEGEGADALAPLWSIPSTGPPQHTLIADIDGDDEAELLFVVSGRARAYREDGTLEWMSRLADLSAALPPIDLDGDGYMELVFRRRTHGVAILSGRDGALLWRSELEALSAVRTILARDLDGDGLPELVVAERDCGPQARAIGRTIVYQMANPRAPVELLRLEERTRDYECSSANALMDTDGDGHPEIIAVGHEHVYVYSSEDGRLIEVSEALSPIPYGQAEPIVVQLPGRAEQSLLLLTDNNYAPNVNSRKALLVARDDSGALATRWEASVADVGRDRHVWAAQPVLDLDNSGTPDLLHAFFDAASGQWTTYARALDDGAVIAAVPGRLGGVLPPGEGEVLPRVLIADEGFTQLSMFQLMGVDSGDLWVPMGRVLEGEELMETRAAFDLDASGRPRALPEPGPTLLTLDSRDAAGAPSETLTVRVVDALGETLSEQAWPATTKLTPGRAPDASLRVVTAEPGGDVMLWREALAEAFEAPLTLPLTATENAMVVFDAAGQRALAARHRALFDAARANLAQPAVRAPIAQWVFGALDDDPVRWIAYDQAIKPENTDLVALSPTGEVTWSQSGLVALGDDSRIFWRGVSLTRDLDGDGEGDVLVQTDHRDAGLSRAQAYSGASGAPLWSPPLEDSSGVLSNVPPTTVIDSAGATRVALIRGGKVMTVDPATGAPLETAAQGGLHRVTPGALADDGVETLFSAALVRPFWRATDADVSTRWEQQTLVEDSPVTPPFRYYGTGVAFARSAQGAWLIEGRRTITPYDHNLVILDAETGEFLHRLRLEGGALLAPDATTSAQATLNAGVVVTPTDGAPPQYLVAGEDGFLYWLDLTADASAPEYPESMLLAAWSLGAPLGETSAADLDADGALEIMVATLDGDVIVLDQPELETEIEVLDTPCAGPLEDIDATPRTGEFCADWTATGPLSSRFVASLHHSDGGGRVAEPQVVEGGTHAHFEGLRLEVGERYHVVVQGFDGEGVEARSSRAFRSDGALILPNVDPPQIIDFMADPPAFFAVEEQTLISATLHDESGLTRYTLVIRDGDGEPVLEVEEALNAVTHPVALTWRGDLDGSALPPGVYFVELSACDFDDRCSDETLTVELLDPTPPLEDITPPELDPDVMDVADDPPDMDTTSPPDVADARPDVLDDGIIEERVVACECRLAVHRGGGGPGGAALAWLLGLLALRRARRTPEARE